MFSKNNFNLSQRTCCALGIFASRNPRFRLMRLFQSRCHIACTFRAEDNRLASRNEINLSGRDWGKISLLDPAIRHPAARCDPRRQVSDSRNIRMTFRSMDRTCKDARQRWKTEDSVDRRRILSSGIYY
jgi:hypothetical protein